MDLASAPMSVASVTMSGAVTSTVICEVVSQLVGRRVNVSAALPHRQTRRLARQVDTVRD